VKVFITGGAGYIGAHMINALLQRGHTIHALVRNRKKFIFSERENVVLFEGDFMNYTDVIEAMGGCDQVYHLGGCASIWEKHKETYFKVNVEGTKNVLDSALSLGVDKIVFTSTAGVLGPSVSGVVSENKSRDLDFFNEYESSKALAEQMIKSYVIEKSINAVIVCPTRVYGPYLHGQPASVTLLIDKFIKGKWRVIPGDGSKIGNYIFIDDVVEGHILAMEKGRSGT
jgi:nucleoside-diphosphate-sugar epimerase